MAIINWVLAVFFLMVSAASFPQNDDCVLPQCHRMGTDIPGGLSKNDTPQIIFMAFDDSMTSDVFKYYKEILEARTNPNGCPITMTFFLIHQYTEYDKVNYLWRMGNEFASNSISKVSNYTYWTTASSQVWKNEMLGMSNFIQKFAKVTDPIQGMRAPYFEMGGDNMFDMAKDNFKWDSSWPTQEYSENPIWPYTLDHNEENPHQDCPIGGCPTLNYPSFWEVPLVDLYSLNKTFCINPASCTPLPKNSDEVMEFLDSNFQRFYNYNKAPFGMYLGLSWFKQVLEHDYIFPAYLNWLDAQLKKDDVYFVTVSQGLQWIMNPTKLSDLKNFAPWKCGTPKPAHCVHPSTCHYEHTPPGGPRNMISCITCPKSYPWVTNIA